MENQCPCGSHLNYKNCCQKYHDGLEFPENGLLLMRSRYCAYALQKADYIMRTTHPENPSFQKNREQWKQEILHFSRFTEFMGLEIVNFTDGAQESFVTFIAFLKQNGHPVQLKEKSQFVKIGKQWLYREAVFIN